ncbi:MAG: hypothetical protein WKF77_13320 [Planctomycetaceae bacterium]
MPLRVRRDRLNASNAAHVAARFDARCNPGYAVWSPVSVTSLDAARYTRKQPIAGSNETAGQKPSVSYNSAIGAQSLVLSISPDSSRDNS